MRKIKILGEELEIGFCMAVEIAYEEITETAFDLNALDMRKNTMALGMAAIITYNKDTDISMERLLKDATAEEVVALTDAVAAEMLAWMNIPTTAEKAQKEPEDGDAGEEVRD